MSDERREAHWRVKVQSILSCSHKVILVPLPIKFDSVWCTLCDAPSYVEQVEGHTDWTVECMQCDYIYRFGNEPRTASVRALNSARTHSGKQGHVSVLTGIRDGKTVTLKFFVARKPITGSLHHDMVELYKSLRESICSASEKS